MCWEISTAVLYLLANELANYLSIYLQNLFIFQKKEN